MKEPTALSLSQFFTALTGKPVSFGVAVNLPEPQKPCMYAVYTVLPENSALVMRIGLKALALLGAALLGLPEDTATERALATPTDEPMRDAMHEVLNIASTVIGGETRIVFTKMVRDVAMLAGEASAVLCKPTLRSSFRVTVDGVDGETATIYH